MNILSRSNISILCPYENFETSRSVISNIEIWTVFFKFCWKFMLTCFFFFDCDVYMWWDKHKCCWNTTKKKIKNKYSKFAFRRKQVRKRLWQMLIKSFLKLMPNNIDGELGRRFLFPSDFISKKYFLLIFKLSLIWFKSKHVKELFFCVFG